MTRTIFKGFFSLLLLFATHPANAQNSFRETPKTTSGYFPSTFKKTAPAKDREKRDRLKAQHLSRHFADFGLVGLSTIGKYSNVDQYYIDQFAGPQLKIGSSWHLIRGDFRGFLRVTWIRAAVMIGDGVLLCSAPLHLGLGHNFLFSEHFSVDLLASGGLLTIGPGLLDNYVELGYGLAPEIKLNINKLVISAEYSFKRHNSDNGNGLFGSGSTSNEVSHFYSLNFGFRF